MTNLDEYSLAYAVSSKDPNLQYLKAFDQIQIKFDKGRYVVYDHIGLVEYLETEREAHFAGLLQYASVINSLEKNADKPWIGVDQIFADIEADDMVASMDEDE